MKINDKQKSALKWLDDQSAPISMDTMFNSGVKAQTLHDLIRLELVKTVALGLTAYVTITEKGKQTIKES